MKQEYNIAIVLSAGRGSRMKSDVQKQYLNIAGKPVIYYSLKQFEDCEEISEVILVTGEADIDYCKKEIIEKYQLKKVKQIVSGGKERYHSVYQGLCAAKQCDYVFIHDGARPFLNQKLLKRAMEEVRRSGACVVGMPAKDTIKIADDNRYAQTTPDRSKVWTIQTPQVFSYPLIKEAHDRLMEEEVPGITDDAMVLEKMMHKKVKLVEGTYRNIKITTPEDLLIAEAFLATPDME